MELRPSILLDPGGVWILRKEQHFLAFTKGSSQMHDVKKSIQGEILVLQAIHVSCLFFLRFPPWAFNDSTDVFSSIWHP